MGNSFRRLELLDISLIRKHPKRRQSTQRIVSRAKTEGENCLVVAVIHVVKKPVQTKVLIRSVLVISILSIEPL